MFPPCFDLMLSCCFSFTTSTRYDFLLLDSLSGLACGAHSVAEMTDVHHDGKTLIWVMTTYKHCYLDEF